MQHARRRATVGFGGGPPAAVSGGTPLAAGGWPLSTLVERRSRLANLSHPDVLLEAHVVAHEVLEDDADRAAQVGEVVIAKVHAVEQDAPLGRIVQAREELGERRLAR